MVYDIIVDGSMVRGNIGVNPSLNITAPAEYAKDKIPFMEGHFPNDLSLKLNQLKKEWIAKKLTRY